MTIKKYKGNIDYKNHRLTPNGLQERPNKQKFSRKII